MPKLTIPISDKDIRALRIGDTVYLNGVIVLGRDAAHKFMVEKFIRKPAPPTRRNFTPNLNGCSRAA